MAHALAEDPETVVISVDMANALNSVHRAAMFAAVQQSASALLPVVQWVYGEETSYKLWWPRRALLPSCHSVECDTAAPWVRYCMRSRRSGLMKRVRRHRS